MNATITDAAAFAALRPLEVVAYLRSTGWKKAGEKPGQWSTWLRVDQDGDEFEVAVPLSHQFRDFASRMADVVRVLETVEGRSQLQIIRDLFLNGADLIRLRLADVDLANASVPLDEGATFVQRARDLMLAAACAAVDPRMAYPSRKPAQAIDYLRRARLGQTEPGSFVVTIISPVPPRLADPNGQLITFEEPFERRVTQTLAFALDSVRRATETAASTGQVDSFIGAVPSGVSANLCDALVGMGSFAEGNRTLDVHFTWSQNRPIDPEANVPNHVVLSADAFPVIRGAAVYLKESSPREEFEIRGLVVKLERPEGAATGRVTIHGLVDDQPRKVLVELKDADYRRAIGAHDQRQLVRCSGALVRDGRSFRLDEPYGFVFEVDEDV